MIIKLLKWGNTGLIDPPNLTIFWEGGENEEKESNKYLGVFKEDTQNNNNNNNNNDNKILLKMHKEKLNYMNNREKMFMTIH